MSNRLHVHVPYRQLDEFLPLLQEHSLQPEIGFKGADLDQLDADLLDRAAGLFADRNLAVTVHAPFFDLNPGALEPYVLQATAIRFRQCLAVASRLAARTVVFHPGYEYWKYGGDDSLWLEASFRFWPAMIEHAEQYDLDLALENIFETHPGLLAELLNRIDSPRLGHCFDVGHWRLFAETSLTDWFTALGPRIMHLHLHDNTGKSDAHLPVGEGDIDFPHLFELIDGLTREPTMTLEAHSRNDLFRSLENFRRVSSATTRGSIPNRF